MTVFLLSINCQKVHVFMLKIGNSNIESISSSNSFRFGDVTVPSLELIGVNLAVHASIRCISVLPGMALVDVSALFGLDVLDSEQLYHTTSLTI